MSNTLPIQSGDIHIWVTHPLSITNADLLRQYHALMTPEEAKKQARYRFEKDRHDALITRAFVRYVLSQYHDTQPEDWRFIKGEKDKPEIVNPPLPLRFNLSHTNGLIACAITLSHDIGLDVETVGRDNDILSIADRYFSPVEVEELFSLPEEQQRSRFFDYWTLKESYIKAWGLGLAIPLDDFSFHIGTTDKADYNTNIRLSFAEHRDDNPDLWSSWLYYPNDCHRMALSVRTATKENWQTRFFECTPLISYKEINSTFKTEVRD